MFVAECAFVTDYFLRPKNVCVALYESNSENEKDACKVTDFDWIL